MQDAQLDTLIEVQRAFVHRRATYAEDLKMPLSKSEKQALDDLIAAGDLVGAQNILAGKTGAGAIDAAVPAPDAPPAAPRSIDQIVNDLFVEISHALGNRPAIVKLLEEFRSATPPPPSADES